MPSVLKFNNNEIIDSSGKITAAAQPKGAVIEQFMSPCDGSSITVQSGTYTVQNATGVQLLTTTYADVTGSVIDYTPPPETPLLKPVQNRSIVEYPSLELSETVTIALDL